MFPHAPRRPSSGPAGMALSFRAPFEDALLDERVQHGLECLADGLALQLVGGGEAAVVGGPGAGHGEGIEAARARDEVHRYELLVGAQLAHLGTSGKHVGSDRKTVGCVILLGFRCALNPGCVIIDWFRLSCYCNTRV